MTLQRALNSCEPSLCTRICTLSPMQKSQQHLVWLTGQDELNGQRTAQCLRALPAVVRCTSSASRPESRYPRNGWSQPWKAQTSTRMIITSQITSLSTTTQPTSLWLWIAHPLLALSKSLSISQTSSERAQKEVLVLMSTSSSRNI